MTVDADPGITVALISGGSVVIVGGLTLIGVVYQSRKTRGQMDTGNGHSLGQGVARIEETLWRHEQRLDGIDVEVREMSGKVDTAAYLAKQAGRGASAEPPRGDGMTWTENSSSYRLEPVARVGRPQWIECPVKGCGTQVKPHECNVKTCLWYGPCSVCNHTTWITPVYEQGILGSKFLRWERRNTVRHRKAK